MFYTIKDLGALLKNRKEPISQRVGGMPHSTSQRVGGMPHNTSQRVGGMPHNTSYSNQSRYISYLYSLLLKGVFHLNRFSVPTLTLDTF